MHAVVFAWVDTSEMPHIQELDRSLFDNCDVVIAADSGLDVAYELEVRVDHIVGDFDSVSAANLERAQATHAVIEMHPASKDQTDFELAVDLALRLGADKITVIGSTRGRFDHTVAMLAGLARDELSGVPVDAYLGPEHVAVAQPGRQLTISGRPQELISLIPARNDVLGVTTTGLAYALNREHLVAGRSRGVSNTFAANTATVSVETGTLFVITKWEPGFSSRLRERSQSQERPLPLGPQIS